MRRVFGRIVATLAVSLVMVVVAFADEPPHCAKLLTQSEVEAAIGTPISDVAEPVIFADGHSQCAFFTADGEKTVMFTFLDLAAIQDGMISAESIPEYFDMTVRSTEDVSGGKGEAVEGVGVRAVLFAEAELVRIFVETEEGFAEVAGTGVTAKQLEAVARAVTTP